MRPLLRLFSLNLTDKAFLLRCLMAVARVRIGLTFLGYKRVRTWIPDRPLERSPASELQRVAWGVKAAARMVPRASCLTQAVAGQLLLARAGLRSDVRIGVAKDDKGKFSAHAWLMSDDRIVLGATAADLERFTPLTDLSPRPQ